MYIVDMLLDFLHGGSGIGPQLPKPPILDSIRRDEGIDAET